jgi:hypothetical protein
MRLLDVRRRSQPARAILISWGNPAQHPSGGARSPCDHADERLDLGDVVPGWSPRVGDFFV